MQFRIFDGDMERWDEEEISLTPEELLRRFGKRAPQNYEGNSAPADGAPVLQTAENSQAVNDSQTAERTQEVYVPTDRETAHKITDPAYDIFDQDLADRQFADLLNASDNNDN